MPSLSNPPRKQKTREQAEKMKAKAASFERNVLGDEDKAQEFEDMSVEDYALRKRVQLVNPARRREIIEHSIARLPHHASSEDRLEAIREARQAVSALEPGANELDVLSAANEAVTVIVVDCEKRYRKSRWLARVPSMLPFGTSEDEQAEALASIGDLLDSLPSNLSDSKVELEARRKLRPLIREVGERETKTELVRFGVSCVDSALSDLYAEGLIKLRERYDDQLRAELVEAVEDSLTDELSGRESYDEVRDRVTEIIEGELELESD